MLALDLQLDRSKLRFDDDAHVTNTLPWPIASREGPPKGPLDHQPKRSPERLLGQRKHIDRVAAAHGVRLRRNAQRAGI